MTNTPSKPLTHGPSTRSCIVLGLLLIPLAIGSLWIVRCGNHGATNYCIFDTDGEHVAFIYEGYSGQGVEVRCRAFNLRSGHEVPTAQRISGIIRMEDTFAIRRLGGRYQLYLWDKVPLSNEPITFSIPTFENRVPQIQSLIAGMVVVSEFHAGSTRIALLDPKTSRIVDEVAIPGEVQFNPWRGSNCIEIARPNNRVINLLRVDDDKIALGEDLANLQFISPENELGQRYAFIQSADGRSMEVRETTSHQLLRTLEVPQADGTQVAGPQVAGPLRIVSYDSGASWVSLGAGLRGRMVPSATLDFTTGSELPVPEGWILRDRNRKSAKMLVTTPGAALVIPMGKPESKLIDEASGAVIADIPSGRILASMFIADGQQLLLATDEQRVLRLDSNSGKVLLDFTPYWYIPYLEALSAVAYFCWACAWVRCSPTLQRHAWIDCAIITGLSVGYVVMRTRTIGFPGDVVRPIYQFSEGIFASWMILTSLWLVLGRTRLSLRIVPQIGILALTILIALLCVGFQNPRVWELVIAAILFGLWLVVVFLPLRFIGYKFLCVESVADHETSQQLTRGAVPIRDLFLLTTVLAGVFALGRFAPPGLQLTLSMVVNLFVLVFAVTFTGIAAVRLGLSRKGLTVRLLTLLAVTTFGIALPFLWMGVSLGWAALRNPDTRFLFWELRLHTSTAIATALCLYAFRLRGWRLARTTA